MDGAMGLMFICLHLVSGGMRFLLSFITFLIWDWKDLIVSLFVV